MHLGGWLYFHLSKNNSRRNLLKVRKSHMFKSANELADKIPHPIIRAKKKVHA